MRVLMLFTLGFSFTLWGLLGEVSAEFSAAVLVVGVGLFYLMDQPCFLKSVGIFLFGGCLSVVYLNEYTEKHHQPCWVYAGGTIFVEAEVLEFPQVENYGSYSILVDLMFPDGTVAKSSIYGDVVVSELVPGDCFSGEMSLNLATETSGGLEITYYSERGILMRGKTVGELEIAKAESISLSHVPVYMAESLKNSINTVFPETFCGLILALVTGNKDGLSDSFSSSLNRVGLAHTVAVSGMHLSFLAGVLRLVTPAGKIWGTFLLIAVTVLFMLVSGSSPSIMRATVMIILLHIAPLFKRERDDATALSTAVMVILLNNPYAVTHVGLHLSVASVTSIMFFSPKIKKHFVRKRDEFVEGNLNPEEEHKLVVKIFDMVLSIFSVSLSAMILTVPLVGKYYGMVSLIAPISNVLGLSLVTICFVLGLTAGTLGIFFPFLGKIIASFCCFFAWMLVGLVSYLGKIPFAAVTLEPESYMIWLHFVYFIGIIYYLFGCSVSLLVPISVTVLSFGLAVMVHRNSVYSEGILCEVIDVGQGQGAFFYMGETLLVADCGGSSYENVGDLVGNRVNNLGESVVEYLFLSHCDADHGNGVLQLMERVFVEVIFMPPLDLEHELQNAIVNRARREGTEVVFVDEFMEISLDYGQKISLYPPVGSGSINEKGICMLLSVGSDDVLVTGDIGIETEERLVDLYELSEIEVLFVSHHGSRFSTSGKFLDVITPEIAIISVSGTNTYGHPTQEVLDKLEERGIEVLRTDLMGSVTFALAG